MKNPTISILCLASTLTLAVAVATAQGNATSVALEPGKGVGFKSEDGNATLSIGGRIQVRHTYEEKSDSSTFNIPRLRLALKGTLYRDWKWELQSDFAKHEKTTLKDGFVERAFGPALAVRGGQFLVAFDRQQFESSGRQTFADRNIVSTSVGKGRDLGMQAHGGVMNKMIQYRAGVFNGSSEGANNANKGYMMVGRVSINPLGDFSLSQGDIKPSPRPLVFVDLAAYLDQDAAESLAGTTGLAVGAGVKFAGIYGATEYIRRETNANAISDGFYAQASYTFLPEFMEVAARYAQVDPSHTAANDLQTETTAALNVFFEKAGHNLKVTADASLLTDDTKVGDDKNNYRTRAQFQLTF